MTIFHDRTRVTCQYLPLVAREMGKSLAHACCILISTDKSLVFGQRDRHISEPASRAQRILRRIARWEMLPQKLNVQVGDGLERASSVQIFV